MQSPELSGAARQPLRRGVATVCLVNYRTLEMTRLCLRALRRYTRYPHQVVVVDNDSDDASLDYLRTLRWIRLIEHRPSERARRHRHPGNCAHGEGLERGFLECDTEYFVAMHSDAIVRREGWLAELVAHAERDPAIACVGSGKLETISRWYAPLQRLGHTRRLRARLRGRTLPGRPHYNRTICCLYRTEILRRERLSFLYDEERDWNPGKRLYRELVERGIPTVELPDAELARSVVHLAHASQQRPEFRLRPRTRRKHARRLRRALALPEIAVLRDDSSD